MSDAKENSSSIDWHPHNNLLYPLDPKLNNNILKHLTLMHWKIPTYDMILDINELYKSYNIERIFHEKVECKIYVLNNKQTGTKSLLKTYKTYGNFNIFNTHYKEFLFVRETELIEYSQIYYNHKKKKNKEPRDYIQKLN
eukprot:350740_1